MMDDKDKALINLLKANSRESTAELARKLGLSRSTVKDRIERLEKRGIIKSFTIQFAEDYERGLIRSHVMISSNPKKSAFIVRQLKNMPSVMSLYAVNGMYDMIAIIEAESTQELDRMLDTLGDVDGIEKTLSTIVLSTKFER